MKLTEILDIYDETRKSAYVANLIGLGVLAKNNKTGKLVVKKKMSRERVLGKLRPSSFKEEHVDRVIDTLSPLVSEINKEKDGTYFTLVTKDMIDEFLLEVKRLKLVIVDETKGTASSIYWVSK